jgi:hypothetical protein
VIISLVRSDVREDGTTDPFASIGFLKSSNRTNVAVAGQTWNVSHRHCQSHKKGASRNLAPGHR